MNRLKRFPHFRQNNVSDCGPTCLRMIARYYGVDYTAEMLRRHCHVSRRGVNMLGISEGAEHIGLDTVGMKMTFSQLAEEGVFPCILYWNQSHFVVCYGIERDKAGSYKIHISDPASQRLTYTREEFERCWIGRRAEDKGCGVALMLEPGENWGKVEDEYRKNSRSILFLDEATNSLDATNEAHIMDNLHCFYKGRTVVVSAHRLSTVKDADQIIVMDKGKIVERGNHQSLLEKRGRYYELVKNQMSVMA